MRLVSSFALLGLMASAAAAQDVRRMGAAEAPISASVEVAPGSRLIYVSGNVPDPVDANAPAGSLARYGDTATQTRSVLRKLQTALGAHGLGLGDVVMMRVFLVAPPGQPRMDFAGMMTAYREFFGTTAQPNRPARSTMQVAGLVDPGFLVEIEVTAAARPGAAAMAQTRSAPVADRAAESDAALIARADAITEAVGAAAPDYAIGLESGQAWVWAASGGYLMVSDTGGGRRDGSRFYYFAPGSTTPFLIRTARRNIIVRRGEMTAAYEMDGDPVAMAAMTASGSTAVARGEALGAAFAAGNRQAVDGQAYQSAQAEARQAEQRAETQQRQAENTARRQAEAQAERQREQAAPPPPPPPR